MQRLSICNVPENAADGIREGDVWLLYGGPNEWRAVAVRKDRVTLVCVHYGPNYGDTMQVSPALFHKIKGLPHPSNK